MKISFLASHGGSAAKHIIASIRNQQLGAEIGVVITNNQNSEIHQWCKENKVDVKYISGHTHANDKTIDNAICQALVDIGTDLVVLSGYMKKIGPQTLTTFHHQILNMHPSLLPKHGGQGLYGDKVHEAVLKADEKESGATVHLVNGDYDEGPVIAQQKVMVAPNETVASLKTKVQGIEAALYLNSIKQLLIERSAT